jgi:hypothetical protein
MGRKLRRTFLIGNVVLFLGCFCHPGWPDIYVSSAVNIPQNNSNEKRPKGTVMADSNEAKKKPVYLVQLLERLRVLSDEGFDFQALAAQYSMQNNVSGKHPCEVADPGRLAIQLRRERKEEADNEWTDIGILEGREWLAIFKDVLNCPIGTDEPSPPSGDLDEQYERAKLEFEQAIPEYPMLARIWDTYIDVTYEPNEVEKLLAECMKVRSAASSNLIAEQGLDKLINACHGAIESGASIHLSSD